MNQRTLSYFLTVYEYKSIKLASEKLMISPQGLSKTIIGLEKELGNQLFTRSSNHMEPTRAALRLHLHAQKILHEFSCIENGVDFLDNSHSVLSIVSSYGVLEYLGIEFIHDFYEHFPNIQLNFVELTDLPASDRLRKSECELAILSAPLNTTEFSGEFLFSCKHCLVINNQNPLSQKSTINYEDLENQPLALKGREYNFYNTNISLLLAHGIQADIYLETSNDHLILDAAQQNLAIGITLDYIAFDDRRPGTTIIPFTANDSIRTLYIAQKKDTPLSTDALKFKGFLQTWIEENNMEQYRWK